MWFLKRSVQETQCWNDIQVQGLQTLIVKLQTRQRHSFLAAVHKVKCINTWKTWMGNTQLECKTSVNSKDSQHLARSLTHMQHIETSLLDSISSPDASPAASSGKATLPVQSKQLQQNGGPCAKEEKKQCKNNFWGPLHNVLLALVSNSVAVSYTHLTLPTNREV